MFWCTPSGLVFGAWFEITIVHTPPPIVEPNLKVYKPGMYWI